MSVGQRYGRTVAESILSASDEQKEPHQQGLLISVSDNGDSDDRQRPLPTSPLGDAHCA